MTTSSTGALGILRNKLDSGYHKKVRKVIYLMGAAHDDAVFKNKVAMRREGVENILCSECMDQPRASMRKKYGDLKQTDSGNLRRRDEKVSTAGDSKRWHSVYIHTTTSFPRGPV